MNPNNPTGQCFSQTGVSLAPDQLPLPGSEWRTPPREGVYICGIKLTCHLSFVFEVIMK